MVALLKYQAFCHRVLKLIGFKLYMVITSTEVYLFMLLVVDSDCDMNVLLVTAFELDRKNHMLSE